MLKCTILQSSFTICLHFGTSSSNKKKTSSFSLLHVSRLHSKLYAYPLSDLQETCYGWLNIPKQKKLLVSSRHYRHPLSFFYSSSFYLFVRDSVSVSPLLFPSGYIKTRLVRIWIFEDLPVSFLTFFLAFTFLNDDRMTKMYGSSILCPIF